VNVLTETCQYWWGVKTCPVIFTWENHSLLKNYAILGFVCVIFWGFGVRFVEFWKCRGKSWFSMSGKMAGHWKHRIQSAQDRQAWNEWVEAYGQQWSSRGWRKMRKRRSPGKKNFWFLDSEADGSDKGGETVYGRWKV